MADDPPPFDPQAGLRTWSDLQRRGIDAANEMMPSGLVDQLVGTMNAFMRALTGGAPMAQSATVPSAGAERATHGEVGLGPVVPGWTLHGELILDHDADAPAVDVEVVCADLRAASGAVIEAGNVGFEPPELAAVPARSSRCIAVSVTVPEGAEPGSYRTIVQATNLPDFWAPLSVVVEDPSAPTGVN